MKTMLLILFLSAPAFGQPNVPRFDFTTGQSDPISDTYFQFKPVSPAAATWHFSHWSNWRGKVLVVDPARGIWQEDAVQTYSWTRPLSSSRSGGATTMTGWSGPGAITSGYLPTVGLTINKPGGVMVTWLSVESLGQTIVNLNASDGSGSAGIVQAVGR